MEYSGEVMAIDTELAVFKIDLRPRGFGKWDKCESICASYHRQVFRFAGVVHGLA